jgi:hypothetical protein
MGVGLRSRRLGNIANRLVLCFVVGSASLAPGARADERNESQEFVLPVGIYGDVDRRMTEAEYAQATHQSPSDIRQRYAPTGTLFCRTATEEFEGSAQLTLANDVITTAAHLLARNRLSCENILDVTACVFTIQAAGRTQQIAVERLVGMGFKCPAPPKEYQDWAVMKLLRPARDVTPYRVDPTLIDNLKPGDKVINVCHSQDFQRKGAGGEATFPKHIGGCEIKRTYRRFGVASTDCDIGETCSGGSLLRRDDDDPALLGILEGSFETAAQAQRSLATGLLNKGKYVENVWATHHVLITGEFLDMVRRAAGVALPIR